MLCLVLLDFVLLFRDYHLQQFGVIFNVKFQAISGRISETVRDRAKAINH